MLNFKVLKSLSKHVAAKKDIRYYLNGVNVRIFADKTIYAATDGHRVCLFVDIVENSTELQGVEFTISNDDIKKIPAPFSKNFDYTKLEKTGDKYMVADSIIFTPLDGKFPDVSRVVPDMDKLSGEHATINFEYLVAFQEVCKDITGKKVCVPALYYNGAREQIMTCEDLPNILYVVMPIQAEQPEKPNINRTLFNL